MSRTLPAVVLIVEDESIVRMYAVSFVQDAGFEAISASNADEAVLILEARLDVRVVFTDIDMPGSMDGMKLAAAIRNRWPPIELIITSGQAMPNKAEIPCRGRFFSKPYSPDEIVRTIRTFSEAA
ncbi:response regulator [Hansschlegelia beijingensis]